MFTRLRMVVAVAALTVATYATAVETRGSHPETYVVVRGDTLWDIAGRFLGKPWLWPEIWQANPQVQNPHLIFPGDVLSLAYLDRVAVQPGQRAEGPVNAVNLSEIEPFLKDLRIVDSIDDLPYVVGLEDDRLRSTRGQVAYVRGLQAAPGQRYLVVRAEKRYASSSAPACAATCSRARISMPAGIRSAAPASSGPMRCSRARTPRCSAMS